MQQEIHAKTFWGASKEAAETEGEIAPTPFIALWSKYEDGTEVFPLAFSAVNLSHFTHIVDPNAEFRHMCTDWATARLNRVLFAYKHRNSVDPVGLYRDALANPSVWQEADSITSDASPPVKPVVSQGVTPPPETHVVSPASTSVAGKRALVDSVQNVNERLQQRAEANLLTEVTQESTYRWNRQKQQSSVGPPQTSEATAQVKASDTSVAAQSLRAAAAPEVTIPAPAPGNFQKSDAARVGSQISENQKPKTCPFRRFVDICAPGGGVFIYDPDRPIFLYQLCDKLPMWSICDTPGGLSQWCFEGYPAHTCFGPLMGIEHGIDYTLGYVGLRSPKVSGIVRVNIWCAHNMSCGHPPHFCGCTRGKESHGVAFVHLFRPDMGWFRDFQAGRVSLNMWNAGGPLGSFPPSTLPKNSTSLL